MINKKRLINEFCNYVKINSESGNEGSLYNKLLQDVKELGFTVITDNAGEKCGSNANNFMLFYKEIIQKSQDLQYATWILFHIEVL